MGWRSRGYNNKDSDGWQTVGTRGGRWGNSKRSYSRSQSPPTERVRQLRQENHDLRKKVGEAERIAAAASDRTKRPAAKDSVHRHGDWMCAMCSFTSNRAHRGFCYRCAEPKGLSCGTTAHSVTSNGNSAAQDANVATPLAPTALSPGGPNSEVAKSIKQRIASLESARTALAGCPGCSAEKDRLELDIAAARASLSLHLPVEVAVKTTLAPAQQARASVTKAEAKLSKIESQLTALVEQHNAAAAELETARTKLVEAEAATARAAAAALPTEHYVSAVAADPGPFWAAFKAVILQKCPPMSQDAWGQMDLATKAFEAAITPVFSQPAAATCPPQPEATTAAVPTPLSNPPPPVLAPHNAVTPAATGLPSPSISLSASTAGAAAAASVAAAMPVLSPAGQPASADDAIAQALAANDIGRTLRAAASAPVGEATSDISVENSLGSAAVAHPAGNGGGSPLGAAPAGTAPAGTVNDSMGGGAADQMANKRSSDAVTDARAIVAKAKARAVA